jgi:cytochrome b involved in lipid metabolism
MKNTLISIGAAAIIGGSSFLGAAAIAAAPNTTKQITFAQVKKNNKSTSCWTVVNNKVYNVTKWINQHPGGASRILGLCGKNGTFMFGGQHSGQSAPENILASYQIGVLKRRG